MSNQKPTHFANTFNSDVSKRLVLPEFFELEEPCDWNAIAYLKQLLQKNPAMSTRNGNKALVDDIRKVQAHVVPGTIADTTLRQMENSLKASKGKKAIREFWKNSSTDIASTSIRYQSLKYQLQGHMAQEVVDEIQEKQNKRLKVRHSAEDHHYNAEDGGSNTCDETNNDKNIDAESNGENENDGNEDKGSDDEGGNGDDGNESDIWEAWKELLKHLQKSSSLPPLSPESNDMLWCGKDVLRRPLLPVELFNQLNNEIQNIEPQRIHPSFRQIMLEILDSQDKQVWQEAAKKFQNFNTESALIASRDLISNLLEIFSNLFDGASETLSVSEGCLRFYVVDPALQACNKYLKYHGHNTTFYPGEVELKAMTVQLKAKGITDKRLRYNGDGTILVNSIGTEILLSEVSSAFGENNRAKTSFDHYKAMFGLLGMLRTLASKYKYARFDTFKKLKVHFIHTHNHAIRHWTMCTPSSGLYVMNKEQKVIIADDFQQRDEGVVPFMNFMITLGVSLEETMEVLLTLQQEHSQLLKTALFDAGRPQTSLLDHVNPMIVRLNESKHTNEVANDGPRSPTS